MCAVNDDAVAPLLTDISDYVNEYRKQHRLGEREMMEERSQIQKQQ